jgi:hypothetical protein
MFTNTQTPEERLRAWRDFRHAFSDSDSDEDIAKAFESVKIKPRYIDYYTPETWPSVFEIVSEGYFCQTGLTLVIASTLQNLGFINVNELRFDVVSNNITGADGAILIHNSKCYNFLPGEVVTEDFARSNSVKFSEAIITTDKLFA